MSVSPHLTYEDYTFNVKCRNTNTGVIYANSTNFTSATGPATFGRCNPAWQYAYVIPSTVTSGTQNTVTITATSREWVSVQGKCFDGTADAQTSYCRAIACTSCPACPRQRVCTSGCSSPILIDVTGQGFSLTSFQNGVKFDIMGTGTPEQISWTAPGSNNAFLALPGADGLVDNGKQLFGNFTAQPSSPTPNGFLAQAVYDDPKNGGNGDGIIDSRDAVFTSLRLWIDANHDGICQPEELHTLPSLGVNSISLTYKEDDKTDQYGNQFRYRARLNPDQPTVWQDSVRRVLRHGRAECSQPKVCRPRRASHNARLRP